MDRRTDGRSGPGQGGDIPPDLPPSGLSRSRRAGAGGEYLNYRGRGIIQRRRSLQTWGRGHLCSGRGLLAIGGALLSFGPPLFGSGFDLKLNRRSLWKKGRNFERRPGSLEIGRSMGVGGSKRRSTWKVGQSVTQIPLVPPSTPPPHCLAPLLLIGAGFSARQTSLPLCSGFTKAGEERNAEMNTARIGRL